MVSNNYINKCKQSVYQDRLGRVYIDGIEEPLEGNNTLQSITFDDSCYVNGAIIGSTYSKKVEINILDYSISQETENKNIYPQIGVIYDDNTTEYLELGKYTVESISSEQTDNYTKITAYDVLGKLDNVYVCSLDFTTGNKTVADFYEDVCGQLGVIPKTTTFINSDLEVAGNPFTNKEKIRDVLSDIEEVACAYSDIDWDTNQIDLVWLSNSEEPDYVFETSDYSTLNGGSIVYGPVNTLVIRDSQIEGENVTRTDEESIEEKGETELVISDNYFLYNEELRTRAIDNIWNKVKGLTYIDYELTTYYGKPFLKKGMKIGIYTNEDNYFESYILNNSFTYDGTFTTNISAKALTKQETQMKNTSISEAFKRTEQITDKINGQIQEIVEESTETKSQLSQVTQNVQNIQNLFQITGGNNLIKNSVGLFGKEYWEELDENGTYEYGEDSSLIGTTTSASRIVIGNGILKTNNDNIIGLTLTDIKSLSFKIKQDADTTTKITLYSDETKPLYERTFDEEISDYREIYEEANKFYTNSSNLTLKIESIGQYGGKVYISDLILNNGEKTNWQPAVSEIWGTVIKLSQLGITVYSVDGNYATLMTSQGVQVRYLVNNEIGDIITQFTKNGIETIDIEQKGKHIQNNLVSDCLNLNGSEIYVRYIR